MAAVCALTVGCAAAEKSESSSLHFAVTDPGAHCSAAQPVRIASNVCERDFKASASDGGFGVRYTEHKKTMTRGAIANDPAVSIEGGWLAVDGQQLWSAPKERPQWMQAAKIGSNIALAYVVRGELFAGSAGRGVLYGPMQKLGAAASTPDIAVSGDSVAITWEAPNAARIAVFHDGVWSVRDLEAGVMEPRISRAAHGYVIVWREGGDHHEARAQILDESARPLGSAFDPAPGLEVVRADVAANGEDVLVASLVATEVGLDVMTSTMSCALH